MAVIQVSKIQVRSGLQEDLPALDTGEFGWSVDTQRLFIGKGTLAEGAPETGVTEILTEYSVGLINVNIVNLEANVANLSSQVSALTSVAGNLVPATTLLLDDQTNIVNIASVTVTSLTSRIISYNITRGTNTRVGTVKVTNVSNDIVFDDDYSETASTGVTLYFTGNTVSNTAVLGYTTSNISTSGNITYVSQPLG